MANSTLSNAKAAKKDEFYTMFYDIETEMEAYLDYNPNVFRGKTVLLPCDDPEWSNFTKYFAQNFKDLGLKKLISTSYAPESMTYKNGIQLSLFETQSAKYDKDKTKTHGKIFVLTEDSTRDRMPNLNDLQWDYLEGDGDFRSEEVKKLRDEADIIITNPPFSLFREFLAWIVEANKQFIIIGNINCVTYKEVFPLIKDNKVWMGYSIHSGDREFGVPDEYPLEASGTRIDENGKKYIRVKGVRWYTNIDHGHRHSAKNFMTMADNIKFSKHKEVHGRPYLHFDNFDAIEVPYTDAIPCDYEGMMGVGRTEIMRALFGVDSCKHGEVYLHGKKVCIKKPEDAIKAGIGFITENRKSEGLILDFSISRNIALPSVDTFAKRSVINAKNETAFSEALSKKLGVKTASIDLEAGALSGGNQQKVVIAKWIGMNPSIIIMDEPTRGIDVGAKRDIYDLMNELTSQGVAIIMVSSELPEVIGMSDRILVIHEGKIAGELDHKEATQEKIITLATVGTNNKPGILVLLIHLRPAALVLPHPLHNIPDLFGNDGRMRIFKHEAFLTRMFNFALVLVGFGAEPVVHSVAEIDLIF